MSPQYAWTRCFREHLYLDSQDAKDDEKGTADENYVSYRLQRGDQCLHNQFEARSSTDNPVRREKSIQQSYKPSICWAMPHEHLHFLAVPEGAQCAQKPENPEHTQDLSPARHRHGNVNQRHKHQETIQNVPTAAQVCLLSNIQTHRHHLQQTKKQHLKWTA